MWLVYPLMEYEEGLLYSSHNHHPKNICDKLLCVVSLWRSIIFLGSKTISSSTGLSICDWLVLDRNHMQLLELQILRKGILFFI